MIELKKKNPLILLGTSNGEELLICVKGKSIRTKQGVVFNEDHYGFCFMPLNGSAVTYGTQCPIFGVEIENGILRVLEHGKFFPWKIDVATGEVIECAKFFANFRRDIEYLEEKFGLGIDDLDSVNSYLEDENKLKKQC